MSEQKTEKVRLAFCEPSSATVRSKEHIRVVGPEGFKYGGGIPTPALCGYDLRHGWDLNVPVHPARFNTAADLNPTCAACVDAFFALSIPSGGQA